MMTDVCEQEKSTDCSEKHSEKQKNNVKEHDDKGASGSSPQRSVPPPTDRGTTVSCVLSGEQESWRHRGLRCLVAASQKRGSCWLSWEVRSQKKSPKRWSLEATWPAWMGRLWTRRMLTVTNLPVPASFRGVSDSHDYDITGKWLVSRKDFLWWCMVEVINQWQSILYIFT